MSFINDKTTFLFIDDFNGEVCVHHTFFSTNYHAGKKKLKNKTSMFLNTKWHISVLMPVH